LSRTLKTLLQKGRPFILRRVTGKVAKPTSPVIPFTGTLSGLPGVGV